MGTSPYLAETINGCIARKNGDTPWSGREFAAYYSTVKSAGNLVLEKGLTI